MDRLYEHRVHLLYCSEQPTWKAPASWTFRGLQSGHARWLTSEEGESARDGAWLQKDWQDGLHRYDEPIWLMTTLEDAAAISADILSPIVGLLHGANEDLALVYRANWENRLECLVSGQGLWSRDVAKEARTKRTLVLRFGKSALRRLALKGVAAETVGVRFNRPSLLQFRSGVSVLDLPLQIDCASPALHPEMLVEAVHALTRYGALQWHGDEGQAGIDFHIADIAQSLLQGPWETPRLGHRVFTLTYASVDADERNAADLSVALAKHYTGDYQWASADHSDQTSLQPFDYLWGTAALEGASIVLKRRTDQSQFLSEFYDAAVRQAYLPLTVLAIHARAAWTSSSLQIAHWPLNADGELADPEPLRAIRSKALAVRLAYEFPAASQIAAHEAWRDALDLQLRLPQLRQMLAEDIVAAETLIRNDVERRARLIAERSHRRFDWISTATAGIAACLTTFTIAKDVLAPSYANKTWPIIGPIQLSPAATVATLLGLIIGVVAAVVVHDRARARERNSEIRHRPAARSQA